MITTSTPETSLSRTRGLGVILASLRTKAALVAVAFVLVLVAGIGFIIIRHERLALTREVELRVLAQARSLATTSERIMLEPDPELTFQKLLRETMAKNPELLGVVVVDAQGIILAHPEVTLIGKPFPPPEGLTPVRRETFLSGEETLAEGENDFLVSTPITRTFEGNLLTVGRVYIRSSKEKINATVKSARGQVTTIALIVSLLGSIIAVILSGFITTPIRRLAAWARRLGEGDLTVRADVTGRDEIGQLSHSLNEMAARLADARSEMVEKERMAKELEIARDIQQSLLPRDFKGIDAVAVAATCRSATEVGGDYFDLIPIDRRRVGVVMADVAGKGVPGLLVMGVARNVIRGQARHHLSPREVLIRANDLISPDIHRGMFVTVLYGVVDVERRSFVVANAGHNPLIVLKKSGATPYEILKTQGRPVGFMAGAFFDDRLEETTVALQEGDVIFTYTDGVLDALNAEGEEFGMSRLLEVLAANRSTGVQEIVDAVLAAVDAFVCDQPQHDDITVLAAALKPAGEGTEIPPSAAGAEVRGEPEPAQT